MKKMLLATGKTLLIFGMCSTDVYCSKQTGGSSTKEIITIRFFVSGIGQKKTVDAAKICGGAESIVETEIMFNNGFTRFYYFRHLYSAGSCVCAHNNCIGCPSIWATLSALLINILLGSFQLFCIVISLSLRVK